MPPDVLEVYERDVVLKRRQGARSDDQPRGARGRIVALSEASRRRLVLTCRNVEPLPYHLVFTYPAEFPADGAVVKRDQKALLKRIRRRWPEFRGVWWLEFQQRGAPHVHMAATGGLLGEVSPTDGMHGWARLQALEEFHQWLLVAWAEVVASGDPKHRRHGVYLEPWRSGVYGLQEYASKEAGKWVQKEPPEGFVNVGRFWGKVGRPRIERRAVMGERTQLAEVVRVARAAEKANRRRAGLKPRRDKGVVGFTAYGAAEAVSRWLAEGGVA